MRLISFAIIGLGLDLLLYYISFSFVRLDAPDALDALGALVFEL